MKKYIIFVVMISCIGCNNTSSKHDDHLEILMEHRNSRLKFLRDDFKYQILRDRNKQFDFESINDKFISLFVLWDDGNSTGKINEELSELSNFFGTKLLSIKDDDDLTDIVLVQNELLIYDVIILNGLKYMNDFSELSANVMLDKDLTELSRYNIFLTASDSMFRPQVELFIKSDTFPIMVESNGVAIVTMRKKNNEHKHSFSGDIILNIHDSTIRYPFSFPRTLPNKDSAVLSVPLETLKPLDGI